jgi:hypothetical protein
MTVPPGPPPHRDGPVPPTAPFHGPAWVPTPGDPLPGYPWGLVPQQPRPSGRKLLIAAALLLTTTVVAGVLAAWLMSGVFRVQPSPSDQFASGGLASVELRAGEAKMIYVENAESSPQRVDCRGLSSASAARAVAIEPVSADITVNNWKAAFSITAGQTGTYKLTCTGSPGDTFGVGGPASGSSIGASVILILLAGVTGLAGLITGSIGLVRQLRRAR